MRRAIVALLLPPSVLGCSSSVEIQRAPVSAAAVRQAMADLEARASSATLEDQNGKQHRVSDDTYIAIASTPGAPPYYSTKLATLRASCSSDRAPADVTCPLANPAASYSASFEHVTSHVAWAPILGGTLAAGVATAEIGCFASWCDHNARTAVIATDVVVLGVGLVVLLAGGVFHAMASGTRGD
jgi:hypothetical protein